MACAYCKTGPEEFEYRFSLLVYEWLCFDCADVSKETLTRAIHPELLPLVQCRRCLKMVRESFAPVRAQGFVVRCRDHGPAASCGAGCTSVQPEFVQMDYRLCGPCAHRLDHREWYAARAADRQHYQKGVKSQKSLLP